MTIILFDKFKNRLEKVTDMSSAQEEFLMMQDVKGQSYQVKFTLQMYDKKKRPVYVEKHRTLINGEIQGD